MNGIDQRHRAGCCIYARVRRYHHRTGARRAYLGGGRTLLFWLREPFRPSDMEDRRKYALKRRRSACAAAQQWPSAFAAQISPFHFRALAGKSRHGAAMTTDHYRLRGAPDRTQHRFYLPRRFYLPSKILLYRLALPYTCFGNSAQVSPDLRYKTDFQSAGVVVLT